MIKVSKTKLKGVLQISPYVFKDNRGEFVETYSKEIYNGLIARYMSILLATKRKRLMLILSRMILPYQKRMFYGASMETMKPGNCFRVRTERYIG